LSVDNRLSNLPSERIDKDEPRVKSFLLFFKFILALIGTWSYNSTFTIYVDHFIDRSNNYSHHFILKYMHVYFLLD